MGFEIRDNVLVKYTEEAGVTDIVIPNGVTEIGKNAFYYCDNLNSVTFMDKTGWYYASNSTAISGTNVNETQLSSNTASAAILKSLCSYYWFKSN